MNKEEQKKIAESLNICVAKARTILNKPEEIKKVLDRTQTKIDNSPSLIEAGGEKLASMLNLVKNYAAGKYTDASENGVADILGSFIYVTEEFDTVPDIVPLVGYDDDIEVLDCAATRAAADIDAFDKWASR